MWSERDSSSDTNQLVIVVEMSGLAIVISSTSLRPFKEKVRESPMFNVWRSVEFRYSMRVSPLLFVLLLPHVGWWALASHPIISSSCSWEQNSIKFRTNVGGTFNSSPGKYAEAITMSLLMCGFLLLMRIAAVSLDVKLVRGMNWILFLMMSAALGLFSCKSQISFVNLLESPQMPLFTQGSCTKMMSMDSSAATLRARADAPLQWCRLICRNFKSSGFCLHWGETV